MYYNYHDTMMDDVRQAIEENNTPEEIRERLQDRYQWEQELNDDLWINDSVTGNASGSYTFNSYTAMEYVQANTDTLQEALSEFGCDAETIAEKFLDGEWEYFDVIIRCYLLSGIISEVLDDLEAEAEEAEESENGEQ